jgi:hypothetical protein
MNGFEPDSTAFGLLLVSRAQGKLSVDLNTAVAEMEMLLET